MSQPPDLLKGITFDEPFFDSVIRRAGGDRLTDIHVVPQGMRNADYLIDGFVLELKILTADPLDAETRQNDAKEFFLALARRGELRRAPDNKVTLSPQQSKIYWERIIGKALQKRLREAAGQVRDSFEFLPGKWKGGALVVNSAGSSYDWQSFSQLSHKYHEQFPELHAVLLFREFLSWKTARIPSTSH